MDLAIQKAQKLGVGLVVCKGSNHFGIATVYTMQALKKGLIGLCFSNTPPMVAPPRTKNVKFCTFVQNKMVDGSRCCRYLLEQILGQWLLLACVETTSSWTWQPL